jgi:hypothetical protein
MMKEAARTQSRKATLSSGNSNRRSHRNMYHLPTSGLVRRHGVEHHHRRSRSFQRPEVLLGHTKVGCGRCALCVKQALHTTTHTHTHTHTHIHTHA